MSKPMISFRHITKHFPGQTALDGVSFDVAAGEVHALLGENGAGKSTLLDIFHGIVPPTSGEVRIDGERVSFTHAKDALDYGIVKVHQEVNLAPEMTVWENLFLGNEFNCGGFLLKRRMREATSRFLGQLRCGFGPDTKSGSLSVGEKQMVQIARALMINARIISFDEPTSSLSGNETATLFTIIRDLQTKGITILYISHKLDEIFALCDRATVLRDGKYIGTYPVAGIDRPALIKSMVGRDVAMFATRHRPSRADYAVPVLRVDGLRSESAGFEDISFTLHKGEILGFFGLVGAKRTDVMRAVFGADRVSGGVIHLHGKPLVNRHPAQGVANGLALVPENRKEQGFSSNLDNAGNIAMASLWKYRHGPFVSHARKSENAVLRGKAVHLNPNRPDFPTRNLSGGNAQKVVIAKWLSTDAGVVILDEPTKGIDVAAKADIYALMEDMVESGKSVIMVSSELPELMGMSDRIAVMRDGRIVAIVDKPEFAEQKLLTYAVEGTAL